MRCRRMTQRHQLSVFVCAEGKFLFRPRALAGGIEHLWPSESQFHRSLHQLCRRSGEQRVTPLESLRPEGAAKKRTDDLNIFLRQTERVGNDSLQLFDAARAFVNEQAVCGFPFASS